MGSSIRESPLRHVLFPIAIQRKPSVSVNPFSNSSPAFRARACDLEKPEYNSSLTAATAHKLKVSKLDYANARQRSMATPRSCGTFKIINVCYAFPLVPQTFIATPLPHFSFVY